MNWIITFKLPVSSIIIDIISNYYNGRLSSEDPLNGTFINHNYNIAHSLNVLCSISVLEMQYNINKLDVLTEPKKIKEQLEQEIEEMRIKIRKEKGKMKRKRKLQREECNGKQKSIVEKVVIINVQEEQIEKLNDECNNNNKKIESLEKENNTLKGKPGYCNPTEGKKEEK